MPNPGPLTGPAGDWDRLVAADVARRLRAGAQSGSPGYAKGSARRVVFVKLAGFAFWSVLRRGEELKPQGGDCNCSCHEAGLSPGQIQEHHIRAFLLSLEDNFTTIGGNVKVADVEVGSEVGQLPFVARVQVDEPEVLMLNLSSQEHECPSSLQEGQVSSPSSQGQRRQGLRCGLGRSGFYREGSANIGSRVDNEAPIGRPRGIGRVLLDKKRWGATVDWYSEQVRDTVIVRRRGDRPTI